MCTVITDLCLQDLPPEIILQRQRAIMEARKPGKEFDVEASHTGQSSHQTTL
jgi:hypothetical protein